MASICVGSLLLSHSKYVYLGHISMLIIVWVCECVFSQLTFWQKTAGWLGHRFAQPPIKKNLRLTYTVALRYFRHCFRLHKHGRAVTISRDDCPVEWGGPNTRSQSRVKCAVNACTTVKHPNNFVRVVFRGCCVWLCACGRACVGLLLILR